MKPFLISTFALALVSGGALAQSAAPPPSPPAGAPAPGIQAPSPNGGPAVMGDEDDMPPPPHAGPRGHRPPPSKAAGFRIERGDMALSVKCAEDEPMKVCADIVLQMLDKLQTPPKP